jgi:hypothetical protein
MCVHAGDVAWCESEPVCVGIDQGPAMCRPRQAWPSRRHYRPSSSTRRSGRSSRRSKPTGRPKDSWRKRGRTILGPWSLPRSATPSSCRRDRTAHVTLNIRAPRQRVSEPPMLPNTQGAPNGAGSSSHRLARPIGRARPDLNRVGMRRNANVMAEFLRTRRCRLWPLENLNADPAMRRRVVLAHGLDWVRPFSLGQTFDPVWCHALVCPNAPSGACSCGLAPADLRHLCRVRPHARHPKEIR